MFDKVNEAGGINGRKIELVVRDSKGAPQEAAKVTRDLINNDGCQIIIDAEASSGAFAVQEVIREIGVLCMHTNSETSSLTADPKLHVPTAFRTARQGIHDAIGGGDYAAKIAKAKGLKKWATCSPDYAYGRSEHRRVHGIRQALRRQRSRWSRSPGPSCSSPTTPRS